MKKLFLAFLGSLSILGAQNPPIRGPVLGFVFDRNVSAVRAVLGIPGAATLSKPFDFGLSVDRAIISPNQDYVLATSKDDGSVYVWDTRAQAAPAKLQVPSSPTSVLVSPTGAAAGFYYLENRTLVLVAGLPAAPEVRSPINVASDTAPGPMAIADDGKMSLVAYPDETKLLALDTDGNKVPMNYAGQATSIAFFTRSYRAAVASTPENRVYRIWDKWEFSLIGGEEAGVSAPTAVNVTPDNRRVVIINGTPNIMEFDLESGTARTTDCQFTPTNLDRLSGNSVFRMNELTGGPLWLLESGPNESRILFVPPDSQASGAQ